MIKNLFKLCSRFNFVTAAIIFVSAFCFTSQSAMCADTLNVSLNESGGSITGEIGSRIIQLIGLITVLSLAPSIIMMTTAFTKIVIVFSILRNAIGLQQSPPNAVMISLALFLTFFIMQPTLQESYDSGIAPMLNKEISEEQGFSAAMKPLQKFMANNVREKEISLFANIANAPLDNIENTPLHILIPAFMLSEIRKGFEIGFLLFLPFVVIDILVASILMSMGMMMMPPAMLTLPVKLIFFVLIDGWYMLCGSLVKSYIF